MNILIPKYEKSIKGGFLLFFMTFFLSICLYAQEYGYQQNKPAHNIINSYISLFEFNINYERNIIHRPKALTNLRLGYGLIYSSFDGGYYFNPALVQLFGKKNKHFEADLGFKYLIQKGYSNSFLPNVFVGYRYEKPSGGIVFRIGIDLFTLFNIGIGFKF